MHELGGTPALERLQSVFEALGGDDRRRADRALHIGIVIVHVNIHTLLRLVLIVVAGVGYFAVMTKCPRRFCCQQDSASSVQTGCSLPLLTVGAGRPRCANRRDNLACASPGIGKVGSSYRFLAKMALITRCTSKSGYRRMGLVKWV